MLEQHALAPRRERAPSSWAAFLLLFLLTGLQPGCSPEPGQAQGDSTTTELRFAISPGLTRFDPHRATSSYDNTWLYPVYDRLIHMDSDGNAIPGLAVSWRFEDGGRTFELTLRQEVRFHDGFPFNAEAAARNIRRALSITGSAVRSELRAIEQVEAVAPYQLRLSLAYPDAALPLVLSDRAGMMVSPLAFESDSLDMEPVGAGPFRILDYRPGNFAAYERNPEYWNESAARIDRLELRLVTDALTRLNAVRSGQVDGAAITALQISQAHAAGLNVVSRVGLEFSYIQLNRTRSEFGDRRVRRALNYAIDRKALVHALYFNHAQPSAQLFPPGYRAFDPTLGGDPYGYAPETALALLREAGLDEGFAFDLILSNTPSNMPMFEALQAQFAAVGIKMTPRIMESIEINRTFYGAKDGDAALLQWGGRADPSQTLDLLFTPGGVPNPGGHTTPEVARLASRARRETEPAERTKLLRALSRQVTEDALAIVIALPSVTFATAPGVQGFEAWILGGKPEFRGVHWESP